MATRDTTILAIHTSDALLLIGVLEHAIAEGEQNLADWKAGRARFDGAPIDTERALVRMRAWVRVLREGGTAEGGPTVADVFKTEAE